MMREQKSKSVYIIAEAGVNHNGDIDTAKRMVLSAKRAGVDAIKFQTFNTNMLVTHNAPKAEYQQQNSDKTKESQYAMLCKLELSRNDYQILKDLCAENGLDFMSTPFDLDSILLLESIGVDKYKLPSGEITNYPYLVRIAETHKPIILSTGMSTLEEISDAITVLKEHGADEITLLHCTTEYPAPIEDVNLRAMETMRQKFGLKVGYSDHTQGIEIPVAAVAMGACVIEKHFTLDRNMEGPDHKASLEPDELAAMVRAIRNVEKALGNGIKTPSPSEIKNIPIARKSIVAKKKILKGELLTEENITTKRPGNGISPMRWNDVLGTKAIRDFGEDELIEI
ncbi:N-acetylneuraminate synthase [uncultured Cloacibacillus sp.]|uniref:N-acetylneuraminate synthase n=1 Tax=uncultured Cloacibacillus sp. TaxID=889794 RepID=UPI00260296DC|nr:N-acetylneuraminate synthase [uncultured Cloacibacillus sp.]